MSNLKRMNTELFTKNHYFLVCDDFLIDEENRFKKLTQEAKLLYFKMCSRYSSSILNNWIDENQVPYIYFSISEIMKFMRCGDQKAQKLKTL